MDDDALTERLATVDDAKWDSKARLMMDGKPVWEATLGDMLFDSPYIFGEPARSLQISCNTCPNKGVTNPNFFIPGISTAHGGLDVSSNFFRPASNNAIADPVDIPDLRGIRFTAPYGRNGRTMSLREFTRNVIVGEFNGAEPTPVMLDAQGNLAPVSLPLIVAMVGVALFSYNGYGAAVYMAEDMREQGKPMAVAIMLTLVIVVLVELVPFTALLIGSPSLAEMAKQAEDLCTGCFDQRVIYEACRRGVLERQIPFLRTHYREKRDVMVEALTRELGTDLSWPAPRGGFFLWTTLPPQIDADLMIPRAIEHGVIYVAGEAFFVNGGGKNYIRLSFSAPTPERIREGVARLAATIRGELAAIRNPATAQAPATP